MISDEQRVGKIPSVDRVKKRSENEEL
jgi:hypothetical protein